MTKPGSDIHPDATSWPSREEASTLPTYRNVRLPLTLVRGEGSYVYDASGNRYLDLYGGHAVISIGHSHPRWVDAIQKQVGTLTFYSNAVYSPPRAEAAELLVAHSYESMRSVFFCNTGAEANETAMKIARKATGRPVVVSMDGGFHGRTMGALSATGFPSLRQRFPQNAEQWTRFFALGDEGLFELRDPKSVAAVLLEPIQSVAGVYSAPAAYYRRLREFCSRHGICLIFDEVQTGTGRTGHWYAGALWGVEPDIATTAKGVAGGLPAGVVIVNEWIAGTVEPGDQATTFGGHPVAAAGIAATYRIIEDEGLLARVRTLSASLMETLGGMPGVREVRGHGYLIGVECEVGAKALQTRLLDAGIIVGTCSEPNTVRLLPPLTMRAEEWDAFTDTLGPMLEATGP
jgi:acetylornithine/N-succinyldiaminopimelate aminotransferase